MPDYEEGVVQTIEFPFEISKTPGDQVAEVEPAAGREFRGKCAFAIFGKSVVAAPLVPLPGEVLALLIPALTLVAGIRLEDFSEFYFLVTCHADEMLKPGQIGYFRYTCSFDVGNPAFGIVSYKAEKVVCPNDVRRAFAEHIR